MSLLTGYMRSVLLDVNSGTLSQGLVVSSIYQEVKLLGIMLKLLCSVTERMACSNFDFWASAH